MIIANSNHQPNDITELVREVESYAAQDNIALIKKAYQFASRVHEGQLRKSNAPYITHPLAVAHILAELHQDATIISAAILHDTIEDGHVTAEEIKKEFGPEIALLVDGVTKLGKIDFSTKDEHQAENYRKMFLAMAEDVRVIIIKLADRLHNMRTLEFLPEEKQKEISLETREIFAPLAHRLGIWRLKWELEDIAFRFLEPHQYYQIGERVALKRREREAFIKNFNDQVKTELDRFGLNAQIKGRPKHFYSIYKKITEQGLEFNEIYDLLGLRIIVSTIKECYAVLGVIHANWKPIPGRFKDYIAMPKSNMYQSLHTAVIGPSGHPIEIQIRTQEMEQTSEYGVAAHWRYKEGEPHDKKFESKLAWLRQFIEGQSDLKDAYDFLDNLKINLLVGEVFVFTPKGTVFDLPLESTPIDFAYRVHTEVGHQCQGAKVNSRLVPLDYQLQNGDIVEIIVSKHSHPKLDWLNFVKTSHARSKIKQWFKKQKREENIASGRAELERELNRYWLEPQKFLNFEYLEPIVTRYQITSFEDLLEAIGQGEISAKTLVHKILEIEKEKKKEIELPVLPAAAKKKETAEGILVGGIDDVLVRLAKCCNPLPGDEIIGLVTKGRGISIHQKECPNIVEVPKERFIQVDWQKTEQAHYPVEIEVRAFDRVGLLKDVSSKISESGTNIVSVNVRTNRRGSAIINIVIDVKNIEHLHQVTREIKNVGDVYEVYRVTPQRREK
jgi:GTP pyrophosphokinase